MSICDQLQLCESLTSKDERAVFFLGNLAWYAIRYPPSLRNHMFTRFVRLDVIRSLSDPTRLCFSSHLRQTIIALSTEKFEQVNGCPRDLFLMIGNALESAKSYSSGQIDHSSHKRTIFDLHIRISLWKLADWQLPDNEPGWNAVGEGYRHSMLLYTSRILSPEKPAEASLIQESVNEVLDAVSKIPHSLIQLMIMPLFIAGTDALSSHSRHYILLVLDTIKGVAGFSNDVPKILLQQVWEARGRQEKLDKRNILWTSFVSLLIMFIIFLSNKCRRTRPSMGSRTIILSFNTFQRCEYIFKWRYLNTRAEKIDTRFVVFFILCGIKNRPREGE